MSYKEKIRILHVLGSMNRGGAETFVMNIYRNIDREDIQFDFLLTTDKNDYSDEIAKLGGTIYTISPRNHGVISYLKNLNNFLEEHKYSVVHFHASSLSSIEVLLIAKINNVKVRIIHSHSSNQKGALHKIMHVVNKLFIRSLATDYLGCSELANSWMFKHTGVYKKSIMINNGIITNSFAYNEAIRTDMRKRLNIKDELLFGHVGRFCEVKNHEFIIKIFHTYLKKYGNAHLILVGVGELEDKTKNMVAELNIEKNVTFLGLRSDISDLLQAMDIFLFPSLYEGLPVALVEAQASGVMIYGSDTISSKTVLSDNIKFLSLTKNEEFWATYIHDDYLKYKRGDKSKNIIEKGFDIKTTTDFLVKNIYK